MQTVLALKHNTVGLPKVSPLKTEQKGTTEHPYQVRLHSIEVMKCIVDIEY